MSRIVETGKHKPYIFHAAQMSSLLDDVEPLDQPLLLSSSFSPADDSDNGSSPPKQSVQVSQSSKNVRQLSSLRARWIILLLSCVTLAGNYYS